MTYVLSGLERDEFLSIPEFVRIKLIKDSMGERVALLIKSSSLSLKYLYNLRFFRFVIIREEKEGNIVYFLEINEGLNSPARIWSIAETNNELAAIALLANTHKCAVYAYNELAVNIYWANINLKFTGEDTKQLLLDAKPRNIKPGDYSEIGESILNLFESNKVPHENVAVGSVSCSIEWMKMMSIYIPNRLPHVKSEIHIEKNEGTQQEELALWLIDELMPFGAIKNPMIQDGKRTRELTDLLLSHEHGNFLIESKSLSVLERSELPGRDKLSKNISKNTQKAFGQLVGGINSIKKGLEVKDIHGAIVQVARGKQNHAIILVPDLSLMNDNKWGKTAVVDFYDKTGSVLHILDPKELLRLVQGAQLAQDIYEDITLLKAFNFLLIERAKASMDRDTAHFDFIIR